MVEQVSGRKLLHLTETKPYKQALVMDQVVRIGESYTPYFGFYEGSRTYPVTLENGTTVQMPAVKFLKQVRAGNINCPTLPTIAAEVAVHYVMLCRELIMEDIRLAEFNGEPPSRQRCLYACESIDEARQWKQLVGPSSTICELTCTGPFTGRTPISCSATASRFRSRGSGLASTGRARRAKARNGRRYSSTRLT